MQNARSPRQSRRRPWRSATVWALATGVLVLMSACSTVEVVRSPDRPTPIDVSVPSTVEPAHPGHEGVPGDREPVGSEVPEAVAPAQPGIEPLPSPLPRPARPASRPRGRGPASVDDTLSTAQGEASAGGAEPMPIVLPEPVTEAVMEPAPSEALTDYSVRASASERLSIPGPPGELRVWIGLTRLLPKAPTGMSTQNKSLGTVGETARVKPFALGIEVEPKESQCVKIDPSGSELRFRLIPTTTGDFSVGADVELFSTSDCSGAAVPKSAESVTVHVGVDGQRVASDSALELLSRAWTAFLNFWEQVLVVIFALLLFLLRKRLMVWFGFESKD